MSANNAGSQPAVVPAMITADAPNDGSHQRCSNPACGTPGGRWLPMAWFAGTDVKGRATTFKTCTNCRRNDAEKKRKKRVLHANELNTSAMRITALELELGRFRDAHTRCLDEIAALKTENASLRKSEQERYKELSGMIHGAHKGTKRPLSWVDSPRSMTGRQALSAGSPESSQESDAKTLIEFDFGALEEVDIEDCHLNPSQCAKIKKPIATHVQSELDARLHKKQKTAQEESYQFLERLNLGHLAHQHAAQSLHQQYSQLF